MECVYISKIDVCGYPIMDAREYEKLARSHAKRAAFKDNVDAITNLRHTRVQGALVDTHENLYNKILYASLSETTRRIKDWIKHRIPYNKDNVLGVFLGRIKTNESAMDKYTRFLGWKEPLPRKDYTADFEKFWAERQGPSGLFKDEHGTHYYDSHAIEQKKDAARAAELSDDDLFFLLLQ